MLGVKLDFCDVLMVPRTSEIESRSQVDVNRTFEIRGQIITVCPIVAANMDTVGTISMAKELKKYNMMTAIHKHYPDDEIAEALYNHNLGTHSFITVGVQEADRKRVDNIRKGRKDSFFLLIDAANGYIPSMRETISYYKNFYPMAIICAGNVASPEGVKLLADAGVDIVKIGIGSGKLCNTRLKAGVGYPQFSLIEDCASVASEYNILLMSDGGINNPGDIAKAFGIGADFVMVGSMFAGHDECEVPFSRDGDIEYAVCYGMSSNTAMNKYHGGVADYRTCEGRTVSIPRKGKIENTIKDVLGGIRSAGTYINAATLEEFVINSTFIQVNRQVNH
jgi:GMP reductase